MKIPKECYEQFGADLDGCSTQESEGCGRCCVAKGCGMKIEEAIHELILQKDNSYDREVTDKTCDMAIVALEKQIPKKTIYKKNGNIECPSCNCEALRYHSYCWNCGQALKWKKI